MSEQQVLDLPGGLRVAFLGQSGRMLLSLPNQQGSFQFAVHGLAEVALTNAATVVRRSDGFTAKTVQWSPLVSSTLQSIPVKTRTCIIPITFPASAAVTSGLLPCSMTLTMYVIQAAGSFVWADNSFPVLPNQVKFTVQIDNWPWKVAGNRLQLDLALKAVGGKHPKIPNTNSLERVKQGKRDNNNGNGNGNGSTSTGSHGSSSGSHGSGSASSTGTRGSSSRHIAGLSPVAAGDGEAKSKVTLLGPAAFVTPALVQIDVAESPSNAMLLATSTDVQIATFTETEVSGLRFSFPSFSRRLIYDPVADLVSPLATSDNTVVDVEVVSTSTSSQESLDKSSSTMLLWIFLGVLVAVLALLGVGIVWMGRHRRQADKPANDAE